jgi:hypothetical protein
MPQSPQPQTYNGDFTDPPKALARLCLMPNWVLWKWQLNEKGDWTKPPYKASNPKQHAKSNNPETWSDRHTAVNAVLGGKANGTGFVLTGTDVAAVDLDKCRNPVTGQIADWAAAIINAVPDAYVEITVSGTGLRIIGIAAEPEVHRAFNLDDGGRIELFRHTTRYITISGLQLGNSSELPNIDKLIDNLVTRYDGAGTPKTDGQQTGAGTGEDDIDDLIRHGAPEGQRSEAFARCVWSLAGQGLTQEEIEKELSRYSDGIASKYGKRLNREINRCYQKWWEENQFGSAAASHNWNDPDWSILDDRRGELPDFPIDVLTPAWQRWLKRAAHGAGVRAEHIAIPLLGTASSLVGMARRVCASRSWPEPFTLWACVVADSGDRKTPGLRVVTRALDLIEKNNAPGNSAKRLTHETKVQRAKEIKQQWKEDREAALNDSPPREPPAMPIDAIDPGNFIEPRLYVTDPTIERLAELLNARPRGMLLIRDELSGLFANMARYSTGSDRPFWLEAFNGGRHVVERKTTGTIIVDHLLVGIVGTFQPDRLVAAFARDEDGMYSRFLYAWPLPPKYQPLTNEVAEVEPEIVDALTALIRLSAEDAAGVFTAQPIWLSEEAVAEFEEFRKWSDKTKHGFEGRERHWFAKGEMHVLRLAGVLAYLAWAIAHGTSSASGLDGITAALEPETIAKQFMTDAIRLWRQFLWPHARAAMRQIGLTDRHKYARRVLRWIAHHRKHEVSRDEVREQALTRHLDAEGTQDLLESLEKAGWLKCDRIKTRGRSKLRWRVNPKLFVADGLPETPETPESG